jgi:hypothetical protein
VSYVSVLAEPGGEIYFFCVNLLTLKKVGETPATLPLPIREEELAKSLQTLKQLFRENEIIHASNGNLERMIKILLSLSMEQRFLMVQNNQIHKQPSERARAVVNRGMIAEQFDIGAEFNGSDEMTSESEIDMIVSKTGGQEYMKEAVIRRSDQERFIIYRETSQRNFEHWAEKLRAE